MIPAQGSEAEDDGIVVFTALNGIEDQSYFITLNASSMELLSEVGPFPPISWTLHGEFYPLGSFARP